MPVVILKLPDVRRKTEIGPASQPVVGISLAIRFQILSDSRVKSQRFSVKSLAIPNGKASDFPDAPWPRSGIAHPTLCLRSARSQGRAGGGPSKNNFKKALAHLLEMVESHCEKLYNQIVL